MAVCISATLTRSKQRSIRIAVLNLLKPEMRIDGFIKQVEQQVERYGLQPATESKS